MKKIVGIISIIIGLVSIIFVINSHHTFNDELNMADTITSIYSVDTEDELCSEIAKNDKIKIGIYSGNNDEEYILPSASDNCNNTAFYNNNLSNLREGDYYEPWVWFGRGTKGTAFYKDDIKVKDENTASGNDAYFEISNYKLEYSSAGTLKRMNTIRPSEKIFMDFDISNRDLKSNDFKDIRMSFDYAIFPGNIDISMRNSIAYYVYSSEDNGNKYYGPYLLYNQENIGYYHYTNSSGNEIYYTRENIISENLVTKLPENINITKIRIVPYEFYTIQGGSFKIYNFSINGYNNSFSLNKKYISVDNAEDKIRHNIVNKMIDNATLKWNMSNKNTAELKYMHGNHMNPELFSGNSSKIYYGIPYVNRIEGTINSFISQTKKEDGNNYYSYNLPTKYLVDSKTTLGNDIKKGDAIGELIYVYDPSTNDSDETRKAELAAHDYIKNDGYFYGQDCSSAVFYAVGSELPWQHSLASTERYYTSNHVNILGGLSINAKEIESRLREDGVLAQDDQMTVDFFTNYYSSVIKNKYSEDEFYNAYALLIPGDVVDKRGHIRIASGYSHVVCNDNTITNKYVDGFCNNHGGINPDESYTILTEIGKSYYTKHVKESETGWNITLNSKYTDITNIDDLWAYTTTIDNNGKEKITYSIPTSSRSFNVNAIYTFSELYGEENGTEGDIDAEDGMYLPFRFIEMDTVSNEAVEKPVVKYALDKDYNDVERNNLLYDYLRTNKSLKGTFFTNYLIDGIRIDINNVKYYLYPNQTNIYSLYKDLTSEEVLGALNNLDYAANNKIIISFDMGPNLDEVNNAMHADSEGYFEVLRITSPKELINESIESKDSNTVISNDKIDIKIPYNYTLTYSEINNKLDIVSNNIIIKNASGNIVTNNNEVLGTGSKIVLENSEYTIIVNGDINKDGKISSLDYIAVRNHLMQNKIINSSDVAYKAADINNDNKVSALDYVRIRTIMME